ncbi:MAG: lecithin retinol acyltransferase family protein [Clostridia bacterium]|nr:lecithin retinol acyltransferase family protein [Clostridia bacterium]
MKWELNEIKVGDAVRVNMGMYYHYGICTGEDRIVQFGLPVINLNPEDVRVCATDIETFLSNKFAEVMVLSKKETKTVNDIKTRIEIAEKSIGEAGYNILHNNCEHFVNRCLFNSGKSSQVEDVEQQVFNMLNPKYVYIAPVARFLDNNTLPKYTKQELKKITNKSLRDQKISAYGLLKYALEKSLGITEDFKYLKKLKNGKPISKDYKFSISHTNDLVAVVVSKCDVGLDLEVVNCLADPFRLKESLIANGEEIATDDYKDLVGIWTKKEAIFKYKNENIFNPKEIHHNSENTKTIDLHYEDKDYVLSIATHSTNNVNIIKLFE